LTSAPLALAAAGLANGAEVNYGLRPEALSLADAGLSAHITMVEPTGPETYVTLDSAVGHLVVRAPGKFHPMVGDTVKLAWSTEDVHLFDAKTQKRIGD
jgi:multiple sugar transport system ATP-binding protein